MELTKEQQAMADAIKAGLSQSQGEIYEGGYSTPNKRLRERNAIARKRAMYKNDDMKFYRESFKKKHGVDPMDEKAFPVTDPDFSLNKVAKKLCYANAKAALREADSSSSFVQFLRAGIQNITMAAYESVPITYDDWVTTVASN